MRRTLLELWAMLVLASVIGFMGPFGTYADAGLLDRIVHWWNLLMGAYVLVRPVILGLRAVAKRTGLPIMATAFWGVVVTSVPLGIIWRRIGEDTFRGLDGYTGLLPFSLLCSLAVLGVSSWAISADRRFTERRARLSEQLESASTLQFGIEDQTDISMPALHARLTPAFHGRILALQSEDHYVRVHGDGESQLLLMRLRDAIAEMEGVSGEQIHRSWWVAYDAIARVEPSGRSSRIVLTNGAIAPVARDSVAKLQVAHTLKG